MEKREQEKYWSELIKEQKGSGQTKKSFCEVRKLNKATFYYWQRRLDCVKEEKGKGFEQLHPIVEHELRVSLRGGEVVLRSSSIESLSQVLKGLLDA